MIDQPPSLLPTPLDGRQRTERPAARRRPLWMAYVLAALLTLATLLVRLALGFSAGDPPLLILFMFPIVVSAYLGGLGPGLLATALATLLANYVLLPPQYALSLNTRFTLLQSGGLLGAGILICVLSEELRRAFVRAETGQRLHALTLASIGDGVITTDTQGHITFLNPQAERLTGWSAAEAIGQALATVFRLIDAHSRAPIDEPVTRVLRSGTVVEPANRYLLIGGDGRETLIEESGASITALDSTVQGAVLVFRDITGREQAQAALREGQERLAGIVGAAMDAIISIDPTQRIVVFNTAAEQMFGCPAAEAIGQPLDRFVPARFRDIHATHIQLFGQAGVSSRSMHSPGTLTALRADGTEFPIEATIAQTVAGAQPLYTVIMRDITARKRDEQELRLSEARFATAFRASPIAMSITTLVDGRFVDINTSHERLFGYARDELVGQSANGISIYADPNQRAEVVRIMSAHGSLRDTELILRTKSGELREVLCSLETIEVDGEACILGSVFDITARKQAEAALRVSEERLRAVTNTAQVGLVIVDQEHRYRYANPAYAAIFHLGAIDLVGRRVADVLAPVYDAQIRPRLERAFAGERVAYELTLPPAGADGQECHYAVTYEPGDYRSTTVVVVVVMDITERKRAEQALHRKTTFVQLLQDVAVAANQATSIDAALRLAIDQICKRIGWPVGHAYVTRDNETHALVSTDIWYLADPHRFATFRTITEALHHAALDDLPGHVLLSGEPEWIADMTSSNGVRAKLISDLGIRTGFAFPVLVGAEVAAVLEFFVSEPLAPDAALLEVMGHVGTQLGRAVERTRAQAAVQAEQALLSQRVDERTAELSAANAALTRAARLKDDFLASMSHELRTPLNAVLGFSEALQEGVYGPLTERQRTSLQSIETSGRHLLELINDILDLSKIEADKLELQIAPVQVARSVHMSLRMVAQTALQKHISVTSTIDTHVETVLADERRLKQILVNLLANAVKFTPDGGAIGLEVQGDVARQTVTFTVWDTGIGIAEADLPRLFKPFVQIDSSLNRQYAGTGLGLALVLRLVQAHGGSVALTSTPGQGSRFSVTLPWKLAAFSPPTSSDVAATPAMPFVHQALVIADSPSAVAQIVRDLTDLGARVGLQTQSSGAVERALSLQPDVIVIDLPLPDPSGWDILRQLKADLRTHTIPVIIVSAVDAFEPARALGAAAFLRTPVDRDMLIQTLRRAITAESAPAAGRPRILLAEDNQVNREVLQDYLDVKGYDVVVAHDGREALIQAQAAPPALILMDIQMPDMDGIDAIQRIRADANLRTIPIVALTALAMAGDRERCLAAGANDYLTKPIHLHTLLTTIDAQLRRGRDEPPKRPI